MYKTYLEAAGQLVDYVTAAGVESMAEIERHHSRTSIAEQIETRSAATASVRFRALQQLFTWCLDEEELDANPMAKMRPPVVPERPVPVLGEEKHGHFRRRAPAPASCATPPSCACSSTPACASASWPRHPQAGLPTLWLGANGRAAMTDNGVAQMIRKRGRDGGTEGLHPHMLRHTFAHGWLAEGGNEGDLMRLAGWKSRQMLSRYGASAADQRAREAHRHHGLGDRL
ncbi:MAG: tyrosine-type recombinase/integrase [Candidatus Limnocylindria bacterium]